MGSLVTQRLKTKKINNINITQQELMCNLFPHITSENIDSLNSDTILNKTNLCTLVLELKETYEQPIDQKDGALFYFRFLKNRSHSTSSRRSRRG
jgi:hypothetical protein